MATQPNELERTMLTNAQLEWKKERLPRVADQFRDAAKRYAAWARGDETEAKDAPRTWGGWLSAYADEAGRLVFDMRNCLKLPRTPEILQDRPVACDEFGHPCEYFSLWWLAFVGWLECDETIEFSPVAEPSYPTQVFQAWKPGIPPWALREDLDSDAPPWLCFDPELLKEHGESACLQSAAAIAFIVNRVASTSSPRAPETFSDQPVHSADFRSVKWYGTAYTFTASQAAIIEILWENWKQGTPDVSDAHLLEQTDRKGSRLVDLFRGHEAWNELVVPGNRKGSRRLSTPV